MIGQHYIREHVGFGNHGSLEDKRRNLAWYFKSPNRQAGQRAQTCIRTLQRDIQALEQEQNRPL